MWLGDLDGIDNVFGERRGHFPDLVGNRRGRCHSGQNHPALFGLRLNGFSRQPARDCFPKQRDVHIREHFNNSRLIVLLPKNDAAAACRCCRHHHFVGGCCGRGHDSRVADQDALEPRVGADQHGMAHQNVQYLVAGVLGGRCLRHNWLGREIVLRCRSGGDLRLRSRENAQYSHGA